MADALSIYHRLPYPLKVAAASWRGSKLKRLRYGPDTERLVADALERESWSTDRWAEWQAERLASLLERAARSVPYYREFWSREERVSGKARPTELSDWPVLPKEAVKRRPEAFVRDDCDLSSLYRERTGGTTGSPMSVYLTQEALRDWYALFEARGRRWNGVSRHDRWAIFGGQLVAPFDRDRPPFWVRNYPGRQLYLSTHHLARRNAAAYVDALARFRPTHLVVYPSSVAALAGWMLEEGLTVPGVRVIISNAEGLVENQRKAIEKAFGCPVRNTYGMAEMAASASECEVGSMHIWPEVGVIESIPSERPEDGEKIVLTGLLNDGMPLIRYEVGDRLSGSAEPVACPCGRGLPIMRDVLGRSNDMVRTPDGRKVFWLNSAFYDLPIREAQVIQETADRLRVLAVPGPAYTSETTEQLVQRLIQRVGRMRIDVELVELVPRKSNGKFRGVVSMLPDMQREESSS
jgi:phenylacetate-CoA ligase